MGWRSLKKNSARLSTSDMFYIHCIDPNVKFEYSSRGEASLNLVTVLAHVSLPPDLCSRRLFVCFHEGNHGFLEG